MRRLLLVIVAALALVPRPDAGTLFLIDGRGWGHGVGMSQYGADGYAHAGWGYRRILDALLHRYGVARRARAPRARAARPGPAVREDQLDQAVSASWMPAARRATLKAGGAEPRPRQARQAEPEAAAALRAWRRAAPARRRGLPRRARRPQARGRPSRSSTASRSTATCAASCRGRCRTTGIRRRCARRPWSPAPTHSRR